LHETVLEFPVVNPQVLLVVLVDHATLSVVAKQDPCALAEVEVSAFVLWDEGFFVIIKFVEIDVLLSYYLEVADSLLQHKEALEFD
jgi:hypothetical protein